MVGVQEPERNTRKLADLLGWYASPQAHVISRFPVLDPPDADGLFAYVMPEPGRVVAVANVHLPSTPYGPYQVRKGWPRSKVLALERTLRLPALHRVLRVLPDAGRADAGLPHRRLQQPLTPRLDAGGGRQPARGPVRRRVAGEQGSRRGWVRRLLPRRPPRPGGRPRLHLVARRPRDAGQGLLRPHRLGAPRRRGNDRGQQARRRARQPAGRPRLRQAVPDRPPRGRVDLRREPRPGADDRLARAAARRRRRAAAACPLPRPRAHPTRPSHWSRSGGSALVSAVSTDGRTDGVVRLDKSRLRPGRYDVVLVDRATGAVRRPRAGLGVRRAASDRGCAPTRRRTTWARASG